MPTENRSSNTEMVSVPRYLAEEINAALINHGHVVLPRGLQEAMNAQAEQHQETPVGEVVAFGKGLHEIAWAAGRMPKLGAKLYTHPAPADPGEVERLRAALKFYADREHYHFESGNWDTVSGEPLNILWCGDEPDFIEDGTVARNALSASAEPEAT
ncbi:hypothetical protein [Pseudomonas asiatica]|uniref:hypothetical protein n=1 Tax=Pseudomonas asiatica TaxID=2219225 RepID=UPI0018ABAF80|nr:hypothetical protein [Pseudomonas asiatica]MBF8802259.1 hypothetical protein [Pseudomonas asiatica]